LPGVIGGKAPEFIMLDGEIAPAEFWIEHLGQPEDEQMALGIAPASAQPKCPRRPGSAWRRSPDISTSIYDSKLISSGPVRV
jgi:hypothetical protein